MGVSRLRRVGLFGVPPFGSIRRKRRTLRAPTIPYAEPIPENLTVNLNDKSLKVIYNASAYKEAKDERIRNFLRFIHTNEPGQDDFSNRLSALVEKIKDNDKFRRDYTAMNLHDRDLTRAAKQQGAAEKAIEAAKNLYTNGVSQEIIAKSLDLPLNKVSEILRQFQKR